MEWLLDPNAWLALVTLTAQEIVLGIYFAMAFSVAVEMLNIRMRAKMRERAEPLHLRKRLREEPDGTA